MAILVNSKFFFGGGVAAVLVLFFFFVAGNMQAATPLCNIIVTTTFTEAVALYVSKALTRGMNSLQLHLVEWLGSFPKFFLEVVEELRAARKHRRTFAAMGSVSAAVLAS